MGFRIVTKGSNGHRTVVNVHQGGDAAAALKPARLVALSNSWAKSHPGEAAPVGPRIVG